MWIGEVDAILAGYRPSTVAHGLRPALGKGIRFWRAGGRIYPKHVCIYIYTIWICIYVHIMYMYCTYSYYQVIMVFTACLFLFATGPLLFFTSLALGERLRDASISGCQKDP